MNGLYTVLSPFITGVYLLKDNDNEYTNRIHLSNYSASACVQNLAGKMGCKNGTVQATFCSPFSYRKHPQTGPIQKIPPRNSATFTQNRPHTGAHFQETGSLSIVVDRVRSLRKNEYRKIRRPRWPKRHFSAFGVAENPGASPWRSCRRCSVRVKYPHRPA